MVLLQAVLFLLQSKMTWTPLHVILSPMQIQRDKKSNRKAMNRNWSNQKANPALKNKTGNK